jgi:hypothetical protein
MLLRFPGCWPATVPAALMKSTGNAAVMQLKRFPANRGETATSASRERELSLRDVLGRPELLPTLTLGQWDVVLRHARAAALAARLSYLIEAHGWRAAIPDQVRRHLDAERLVASKLARDVERELQRIVEPLRLAGIPVVVLKGAAYIVGDLPAARGRVFTDIDILVPRNDIDVAEQRLILAGWRGEEKAGWDQRFYRRWMHQIPPMVHAVRESVVDLHFAIVPSRARHAVASDPLFEAAQRAARDPQVKILAPEDMILHSATHLFNEGEFDRALRDLVDLDLLLRHFAAMPDFWTKLVERAASLGMGRPLYYALRNAGRFLFTPIPAEVIEATRRFAPPMPALMDALFERALRPPHPTARDRLARLSLLFLYARGHWLRLPLHLLAPHLLRGFFVRRFARLPARQRGG